MSKRQRYLVTCYHDRPISYAFWAVSLDAAVAELARSGHAWAAAVSTDADSDLIVDFWGTCYRAFVAILAANGYEQVHQAGDWITWIDTTATAPGRLS